MTREDAEKLRCHNLIKYVGVNEPATDEEISQEMLKLYKEDEISATAAADALLNLVVCLKKLECNK